MMYFFFFDEFKVGQKCELLEGVHSTKWPWGPKKPGDRVVITAVRENTVFAYDDVPVTYTINKNGKRVEHDPRCIQSCYCKDELKILE